MIKYLNIPFMKEMSCCQLLLLYMTLNIAQYNFKEKTKNSKIIFNKSIDPLSMFNCQRNSKYQFKLCLILGKIKQNFPRSRSN